MSFLLLLTSAFNILNCIYSEELAQRLQAEEDLAAQQAQEQNTTVRGRRDVRPIPHQIASNPLPSASSSRQVEGHDPHRSKNVRFKLS